tara:strand:- start:445 stop:840 length:396 start_codon:yes stop_codon:yes gene_type:complete
MAVHKRRVKKLSINIIPLVDVLTVLLFFFLVTMQFKSFKVLNLILPEITTAGQNNINENFVISIDKKGNFYFNGSLLIKDKINEALSLAKDLKKNSPILIMADEQTELKLITEIMDVCRTNDFNEIRLQSR